MAMCSDADSNNYGYIRTDSGGLRFTRDSFDPRDTWLNGSSMEVGVRFPGNNKLPLISREALKKQNKTNHKITHPVAS